MVCRGDAGMVEVIRVQCWSNSKPLVLLEGMTRGLEVESKCKWRGVVWWMVMKQVLGG